MPWSAAVGKGLVDSRLQSVLSDTRVGTEARALRRLLLDAVAPMWNRAVGCRVRTRGANNRVVYAHVRRLHKVSITILGEGNSVEFARDAQVGSCNIVIRGNGNTISIGSSTLTGVGAAISGDGNAINIGDGCILLGLGLVCEDDGNGINIGAATQIHGSTELAAIEGTLISIGTTCLFSRGIHFRTGDSHSLTDLEGRRINPSRDITIGDHVWVGMNVTVLKGSSVPDRSVIGACSVVSGSFDGPHCVIAGHPARVVREGVDWRVER